MTIRGVPVRDLLPPRPSDWWIIVACVAVAVMATVTDAPRWYAALGWVFAGLLWWLLALARRLVDEALELADEDDAP